MLENLKKFFWKILEPLFPTIRDTWVFFGFVKHDKRQPYHLGWLKKNQNHQALKKFLKDNDFNYIYISWVDPDEVINMRKVVNTTKQYHVRLFSDGEIRGHYEFTPESHPIKHLLEKGMTEGFDYLKPLLKTMIDPSPADHAPKPNPTPRPRHSAAHQ